MARKAPRLVVIGGAEETKGESRVLREFVRLAGGERAHMVVITAATDNPRESGARYRSAFRRLGVAGVRTVDVSQRADASAQRSLAAIEESTGIFFTGGDQLYITTLIGGSPMEEVLRRKVASGTAMAGTSAGAAAMSEAMIVAGQSDVGPRAEGIQMGPALGFVRGVTIDTHFSQRGRHGRMLTAMAHYPQHLGIGIDEDTAIVVRDHRFRVIGSGTVTVFDLGSMSFSDLTKKRDGEHLNLHDITIHVLAEPAEFDLGKRRPGGRS